MKPYRPYSGSEGDSFMCRFCYQCLHENPDPDLNPKCDIMTSTMCFDINDKEYPKEWVQDDDGRNERCTKWIKWDWNNDGDPNDPDNPNHIPPTDPNQLCLPFEMNFIQPEKTKQTA